MQQATDHHLHLPMKTLKAVNCIKLQGLLVSSRQSYSSTHAHHHHQLPPTILFQWSPWFSNVFDKGKQDSGHPVKDEPHPCSHPGKMSQTNGNMQKEVNLHLNVFHKLLRALRQNSPAE